MKTLVIHPKDKTTEFLKEIYEGKDWTVINQWALSKHEIIKAVKSHDRIIMMGHGTPAGLIGYQGIFMSPEFISVLQERDCVCIWCNADQYVRRNNIIGFFTGMFISEVREARYFKIETTQKEIDYSNDLFTKAVTKYIDSDDMWGLIKESYRGDDLVIQYNSQRLYYRDEESVLNDNDLKEEGIL